MVPWCRMMTISTKALILSTIVVVAGCAAPRVIDEPRTASITSSGSSDHIQSSFRVSQNHVVAYYPLPGNVYPEWVAEGSDGNVWFTETGPSISQIGRITVSGSITEFPTPTVAYFIAAGNAGKLWYLASNGSSRRIGRITTNGQVTEFALPRSSMFPSQIVHGPDGAMWFTDPTTDSVGRITANGVVAEYPVPTASAAPNAIARGPDGNLWFTEFDGDKVGRMTTSGAVVDYPIPQDGNLRPKPIGIVAGQDGNLWVADSAQPTITEVTTTGTVTNFTISNCFSFLSRGTQDVLWISHWGECGQTGIVGAFNVVHDTYTEGNEGAILTVNNNLAIGADGNLWFSGNHLIGVYVPQAVQIGIRLNGELSYDDPNYGFELGYALGRTTQTQTIGLRAGEYVMFRNLDTIPHSAAFLGDATANSAPWPTSFTGSTVRSPAGTSIGTPGWATGSLSPNAASPIYSVGTPGFYMIGDQHDYVSNSMRTVIIVQ